MADHDHDNKTDQHEGRRSTDAPLRAPTCIGIEARGHLVMFAARHIVGKLAMGRVRAKRRWSRGILRIMRLHWLYL